jgi:hypothetical protein
MTADNLEALIGQALQALPLPRAPQGLLPRVLAAVQQPPVRAWHEGGWFAWPRGWQAAALTGLVLLAAGSITILPIAYGALTGIFTAAVHHPARALALVVEHLSVASDVGQALWRTLQPVVTYLVAIVLLMCFACALLGTALNRVLLGRMSEQ